MGTNADPPAADQPAAVSQGSPRLFWNTALLLLVLVISGLLMNAYTSLGLLVKSLIALPGALALLPHMWKALPKLNVRAPFTFDAISRIVASYAVTAVLVALLAVAAIGWPGIGALKVQAEDKASTQDYTVTFGAKSESANTASGERIFGPYWLGWGQTGHACLQFSGYPLQWMLLTTRKTAEFYFPGSVGWPVVVIHGSQEMLNYFPPHAPEMAVRLRLQMERGGGKVTAVIPEYTGGLVCIGCPPGVKLPDSFVDASCELWHRSKAEVADRLILKTAFSPGACSPEEVFHLQAFEVWLEPLTNSRCPPYHRTMIVGSRLPDRKFSKPCRVIVNPDDRSASATEEICVEQF